MLIFLKFRSLLIKKNSQNIEIYNYEKNGRLKCNIYKLTLLYTNLVFEFYIKFKQFVWQKQIFMNYICLQTFLNGEYLQIIIRNLNNLSSSYFPFNNTNLKTFSHFAISKNVIIIIFLDIMSK